MSAVALKALGAAANGQEITMVTSDEIQRRVQQADTARSAERSAAAQQVGELAYRRAAVAEQLADIERQLGIALAAAQDIMAIAELAQFTDVPAADLTRWLTAHTAGKSARTRKRPSIASDTDRHGNRRPSTARTPTASLTSTPPESAATQTDAADAPARAPAKRP